VRRWLRFAMVYPIAAALSQRKKQAKSVWKMQQRPRFCSAPKS